MPTAIILGLIPPQRFEVIRDQIVAVVGVELANQYSLDNTYPNVQRVYVERFVLINSETECPCINVNVAKDDFDNETVLKSIGTAIYNIDIYTTAITSLATGAADQYSMITMNKIAGIVRAILSYEGYATLGLTPGFIQETSVVRYFVADKGMVQDALSTVVGRLQFMVKCEEVSDATDKSVSINELTTTTLLNGSDFGYFYDYRQTTLLLAATVATLTDAFFSNPINEINLLNSSNNIIETYLLNTDFTQSGTTITATTFTFTTGTKIVAKT